MFLNKIVVGMFRSSSLNTKSIGISLRSVAGQTNKTCNSFVCCGSLVYFVMCFMEILPIYPILSDVLLCIRFCAFFTQLCLDKQVFVHIESIDSMQSVVLTVISKRWSAIVTMSEDYEIVTVMNCLWMWVIGV